MNDLELLVQQEAGDEVEEDVSCDSTFMLEKIPEIGEALRAAFLGVPRDKTIYSFMDSARGHGTNDASAHYAGILWNEFKVEVVWQVPRSPETNMLDLGIWMSIQAAVTRVHHKRPRQHNVMERSVVDTWKNYLSPDAFKDVFGRLRIVLSCIVEDGGGNSLVERKRGKLSRDATIVDLIADEDEYVSDDEDSKRAMKMVMIRILKFYFSMGRCCVMLKYLALFLLSVTHSVPQQVWPSCHTHA